MNGEIDAAVMRTRPCPKCFLCGGTGEALHAGMADRLYAVPGRWNLKICTNPKCGIAWLDPMPAEEDIAMAYATYYTHGGGAARLDEKPAARTARWLLKQADSVLKRATGLHRERLRIDRMFLDGRPAGKLLEVGCGDGRRLARLRNLGWEVTGQEVDSRAAELARASNQLTVRVGPLEGIFEESSFDAVIMNHVIEHVHDPVKFLSHCRGFLKTGGVLVVTTPNIESLAHAHFGADCMHLDPPRHLHLFSRRALAETSKRAGFARSEAWTCAARAVSVAEGSLSIRQTGRFAMRQAAPLQSAAAALKIQYREWLSRHAQPDAGEECVLRAVK